MSATGSLTISGISVTRWSPSTAKWRSPIRSALLDAMSAAAPDAVYHLAALTHVGQSWEEPLRVLEVNIIGTAAVLAAARQCGTDPRVLVTSSAEVYGAVTDPSRLPLHEGSPTAPLTPYAASKLAAEAVVAQAYLGHGQHVITVRPFNHIGPGQTPNFAVPALAKRIVDADRVGAPTIPVGNLSARRDFTDVRDVVRAYRLLDRVGPSPARSTTSAPDATCPSARSPTVSWPWPAPRSSSRSTRPWSGRSRSPCCGATRAGWRGPRGGSRRSPWSRHWPTCWPTGAGSRNDPLTALTVVRPDRRPA